MYLYLIVNQKFTNDFNFVSSSTIFIVDVIFIFDIHTATCINSCFNNTSLFLAFYSYSRLEYSRRDFVVYVYYFLIRITYFFNR